MCYTNFEEVIVELVKDKHEAYKQHDILLEIENIVIEPIYFSPRSFERTEFYILKLQDDEFKGIDGDKYLQKAKELLDDLYNKGELELLCEDAYRLKKGGRLYERVDLLVER